jgi:ABC transport system ATP-binding/permease protein
MAKQNTPPSFLYQAGVLSERYLDVFLSDFPSLFLLVFQPLAVAICTGLVWRGTTGSPTLYFVLVFSAVFFGCVNACREIVKEKVIFGRERLVGLQIPAYVASKFWILGIFGLGQALLFYLGLRYFLVLEGNPLLVLFTLYLSTLAGTALGLAISAFVSADVMAMTLVPVALIPQMLFSKVVMPNKSLEGIVSWLEKLTLVKWSYLSMEQLVSPSIDWGSVMQGWGMLVLMSAGLILLSAMILKMKESF